MKILTILICFTIASIGYTQELHWTNINDIADSMKVKEKPILVKLETSWCGYCKKMDKDVFLNKKVAKEMNANYYYVKMDAEGKEEIIFNDSIYKFVMYSGGRGIHQLAKKLGSVNGQIKYPTIVILDKNYQVTKLLDGYLPKTDFYYWLKS